MERKARATKLMLLGVDGMDPRLTRKYVDMGIMPNTKKYIEMGAQRHDLVMLGGHPTVTPPMWTTLATGCYANVHGITGFYRNGKEIGSQGYNIDSRLCKAEQLWNVTAEAGLKTLVFHWPGAAWPPSSDSENLFVVDGSTPGSVGMAVATADGEYFVGASEEVPEVTYKVAAAVEASKACIIEELEVASADAGGISGMDASSFGDFLKNGGEILITSEAALGTNSTETPQDLAQSPIKPASGWAAAPADAKEFTFLMSKGLIRRPALVLKNDDGIYDRVAIYKSKKETDPMVVLPVGEMVAEIVDEAYKGDKKIDRANRNMKLLKLAEDGSSLSIYVSSAMDMSVDVIYSPQRLYKEITENVGFPPPTPSMGCQDPIKIVDCMVAGWEIISEWQANAILHLVESENLDVVFSHFHSIDLEEHMFIKHLADRPINRQPVEEAERWMQELYKQCDRYLGKFIHLLDEDWTILIFSDHAQVAPTYGALPLFEMNGTCTPMMEEMGYTALFRDETGKVTGIDWMNTKAVMQREGHVYLNLTTRQHTLADGTVINGIVDPADQYELEEQIMTDLYRLKSKESGHRIVSVALRNKDAVLLGQGGPEAGDICCWMAEGYNYDHADCLSTTYGESDTSVSPIFIAAGKGLKKGFETERIIRQIDFAPTVAVLAGVRMPAQCEGAPVYQILDEEY